MKHLHLLFSWRPALLAGLLLAATFAAHGQAPGSGGPQPAGPVSTPIDGGASLLLAGALAYGIRRLRRGRA